MPSALYYVALAFTLFSVSALILIPVMLKTSTVDQRVLEVVTSTRPDQRKLGLRERLERVLLSMSRALRLSLKVTANSKSELLLQSAGIRGAAAPDLYLAAQLLTPLTAAFLASFTSNNTLFWVTAGAGIGYLAPSMWLNHRIRARRDRIRRGLPDAIDLLVICVDAGLGLDQAILRICDELQISYPDIQHELMRVHLEQRAGQPRVEAWRNLGERIKLPDLTSFVSVLVQTDRFGTPIARALSNFASELRLKRRQYAEEAASKTKIKILFPLVFCIFPCLFIVLLAPAILDISRGLANMGK